MVWKSALFINHSAQFVTRGELNEHFRHIYKNLRPGTGVIFSVYLVVSTDRGFTSKILSVSYFILHGIWSKQVYFSLHMLWILHRVNFIYLKQATFVSEKSVHLGSKWYMPVSFSWLLFFSFLLTSSPLSPPSLPALHCPLTLLVCLVEGLFWAPEISIHLYSESYFM